MAIYKAVMIFNNGRYTTNIPTDPHTVTTTDIKTNMRHIHTSIVSMHLATRSNNKILRTPTPHISSSDEILVVVVVCPLQPSSSVNSGCPGPESSVLVSSRWACPISSQVTGHWGELRNRTGEVHPVDPFHSLDILFCDFNSRSPHGYIIRVAYPLDWCCRPWHVSYVETE